MSLGEYRSVFWANAIALKHAQFCHHACSSTKKIMKNALTISTAMLLFQDSFPMRIWYGCLPMKQNSTKELDQVIVFL